MTDPAVAIAHGGGLIAARRRFPDAPAPWIDLSTGINPKPYPLPPLPPDTYRRLPEPEDIRKLETVAAQAYGAADPAMVVAAPGTQVLISLLPHVLRHDRVAVLGPTYAEHAAAWAAAGTVVSAVPDVAGLRSRGVAVLCNPNNPDGRYVPNAALVALAAQVGLLVVDEAFADLEGPGLAATLPANAVVLRSFGKTYGLAGLRLGFAVAGANVAASIRRALGPWAVSGAAVAIGTAALADRMWIASVRKRLDTDAARLDAMLEDTGLRVTGGTRLFRLTEAPDAAAAFERLGRAGILVRRFDDQPTWLRFGIPPGGWARIEAALSPPTRASGPATSSAPGRSP